jgi:dUTPase
MNKNGDHLFRNLKMASHDLIMMQDMNNFCNRKKRLYDADGVFVGRFKLPKLTIFKLCEDAIVPEPDSNGSWDLHSSPGPETHYIPPGQRKLISTGIRILVPEGFVGWCRSYQVHGDHVVSLDRLIKMEDASLEVLIDVSNYGDVPFFVRPFTKLCEIWMVACPSMKCIVFDYLNEDGEEE